MKDEENPNRLFTRLSLRGVFRLMCTAGDQQASGRISATIRVDGF